MNKLPFVLSLLVFPAAASASDAEYNVNKSAWDAINLSSAYEEGLSGKDVRVAIVDNGFWATHQEFKDKMTLSGDHRQNHGTAVASVIGAAQNDLGLQGVAYNSYLLAFSGKDIASEDNSVCTTCQTISSIFDTLASDAYKDVKIINASWGRQKRHMRIWRVKCPTSCWSLLRETKWASIRYCPRRRRLQTAR